MQASELAMADDKPSTPPLAVARTSKPVSEALLNEKVSRTLRTFPAMPLKISFWGLHSFRELPSEGEITDDHTHVLDRRNLSRLIKADLIFSPG